MAKRSTVFDLPSDIIEELNIRLVASNFSKYNEHALWLKEKDFVVSKSALHRYGTAREQWLPEQASEAAKIRLQCLDIASRIGGNKPADELLSLAEQFLRWVYKI